MPLRISRIWRHWPIAAWDRLYRLLRGLDRPSARVGPVLRLEVRRCRRDVRLEDGTRLRRGDRWGGIHLDNERVVRLHGDGRPAAAVGLELRRLVLASLRELARRAEPGGPLEDVRAFAAVTIYHRGLARLGFAPAPGASGSAVVGAYQRALVGWLRAGARAPAKASPRAERLWIGRDRLRSLYGAAAGHVSRGGSPARM
jgi:hypothetical protein